MRAIGHKCWCDNAHRLREILGELVARCLCAFLDPRAFGQLPRNHQAGVQNAIRESRGTVDSTNAPWIRSNLLHGYAVMHKCVRALLSLKEIYGN